MQILKIVIFKMLFLIKIQKNLKVKTKFRVWKKKHWNLKLIIKTKSFY